MSNAADMVIFLPHQPQHVPWVERVEWKRLYDALFELLSMYGRCDRNKWPHGQQDFWVLDDDWGACVQHVEVYRVEMLCPTLIKRIQRLLATKFRLWEVVISTQPQRRNRLLHGTVLSIWSIRVDEFWDSREFRRVYRNRFPWKVPVHGSALATTTYRRPKRRYVLKFAFVPWHRKRWPPKGYQYA